VRLGSPGSHDIGISATKPDEFSDIDGSCSTQAVIPIIMMMLASDEHAVARDMYALSISGLLSSTAIRTRPGNVARVATQKR